jgi:hypothetical protein
LRIIKTLCGAYVKWPKPLSIWLEMLRRRLTAYDASAKRTRRTAIKVAVGDDSDVIKKK